MLFLASWVCSLPLLARGTGIPVGRAVAAGSELLQGHRVGAAAEDERNRAVPFDG